MRVGNTQSNISTPRITPSTRQSGLPTPIRYRGFSLGMTGSNTSSISYIISFRFAHRKAANPIADKVEICNLFRALSSRRSQKVLSLDNAKKVLIFMTMNFTALRPIPCAVHGAINFAVFCRILVHSSKHGNIRTQCHFNLHDFFRRKDGKNRRDGF